MTTELEAWAIKSRANGFPEEADFIEKQAKIFKITGMPATFPSTENGTQLEPKADISMYEIYSPEETRTRLIEVLSFVESDYSGKSTLTQKLAREINDKVGQFLNDEVSILRLFIPSGREDERVERINTTLRAQYNRAINSFRRTKYSTVGSIREGVPIFSRPRGLGERTVGFVTIAFARPQTNK